MSKTKRLPETRRQRNSPSHTRVEREEEAKQKVATTWRQRSAPSHVFVSARHSATSVDPPLFARVPNPGGGAGSLPSVFLRGPCGARATGTGISITLSRTPLFFRGPQCQDGNPQQCNERNVTRAKAVRVDCYIAHRPPCACRFAGTFRSLARRPAVLPARQPARPSGDPLAVLPSTRNSSRGLSKGGGAPCTTPGSKPPIPLQSTPSIITPLARRRAARHPTFPREAAALLWHPRGGRSGSGVMAHALRAECVAGGWGIAKSCAGGCDA